MDLIRPGLNIRVVTEIDPIKDTIRVWASTIYDISGDTIIMAQSNPPMTASLFNYSTMITYVKKEGRKLVRYGFPVTAKEVIDYDLSNGQTVKAVLAEKKGDTRPYSIRMFHRVEPSSESTMRLFIGNREMIILDISLGGIRFGHDGTLKFNHDKIEDISLDIGGKTYALQARICRTWESPDIRSWKESHFGSAEFYNLPSTFERILVKRLHQIERDSRTRQESFEKIDGIAED